MKIEAFPTVRASQPRRVVWTKPWKQNEQDYKAYSNNQEENRKEIKRHELSRPKSEKRLN
jgi:hypothetical protein